MAITLTHSATTLTLSPDLQWIDQHDWSPVTQASEHTLTGALVIDYGTRQAGRAITLQAAQDSAWMPLATIESLVAWAAVAGREMSLSMNGVDYAVVFDHSQGAIKAEPIVFYNDPDAADWFAVTLRFLEI